MATTSGPLGPSRVQSGQTQQGIQFIKAKGALPGHNVTRLNIDSNDPNSSVAMLGIKQSGNAFSRLAKKGVIKFSGKYIQTSIKATDAQGATRYETVALNVNSLSKRLGLSKAAIRELQKQGKLSELIETVHTTTEADKTVHQFISGQEGQKASARDITRLVAADRLNKGADKWQQVGSRQLRFDGSRVAQRQQLGAGTYGTAFRVHELSVSSLESSEYAEKVSNADPDNPQFGIDAREDLEIEYSNLTQIAMRAKMKGKTDALQGIQDTPRGVDFEGRQGVMRGKLYRGSLQGKYTEMNVAQRLRGFDPLLKGLAFVQSENLVHADIKPDNIFVDVNDQGEPVFKLADFGGARWPNQLQEGKITHTRMYTPSPALDRINTTNPQSLHRVGTFQMGVSLFQVLSGGQLPYPQDQDGYQFTQGRFNEMALAGYPPDVVDFVKSMVAPNPADRPVGEQISTQWNQLTAKYGGVEGMAQHAQNCHNAVHQATQAGRYVGAPERGTVEGWLLNLQKTNPGTPQYFMRYSQNARGYVVSGITEDGKIGHWKLSDFMLGHNDFHSALHAAGYLPS